MSQKCLATLSADNLLEGLWGELGVAKVDDPEGLGRGEELLPGGRHVLGLTVGEDVVGQVEVGEVTTTAGQQRPEHLMGTERGVSTVL